MITLKEIAAASQVSIATVSYVLNNRTDMRIGERTRKRVLDAARSLGYRRNALALSVKSGRSDMLAIMSSEGAAGYFYPIFHSICSTASERGFGVKICFFNRENLAESVEKLLEQRVSGVIFHTGDFSRCENAAREFQRCGTPVAAVNCRATIPHCASFASDDFNGAAAAVRYLAQCGKRRIACATYPGNFDYIRLRKAGYESALSGATPCHIPATENTNEWCAELFNRKKAFFDGCFCCADGMALALCRYMYERHMPIPEALSIVGFGDLEGSAEAVVPLTTVAQPFTQMGTSAAKAVLDAAAENRPTASEIEELPTRIIVRKSVQTMCEKSAERKDCTLPHSVISTPLNSE